jgi:thiamine biosynthesis protein ThiS
MTVKDLLDKMGYGYTLIIVTVNGALIPCEKYDEYIIEDESNVGVFHLACGG